MKLGKTLSISGLLILAVLLVLITTRYSSLRAGFLAKLAGEFQKQPLAAESILTAADVARLPLPVRKYIAYAGALGKPKVQNLRVFCHAQMIRKPNTPPLQATSVQYNFFTSPARIFFMQASMAGLPFIALHVYAGQQATFVVRVLSLFNMVDIAGEALTKAESVTVLNDLCVFAPAALIDPRLAWKEIGPLSAQVTFTNGPYKVTAVLFFNTAGELVNFVSDDRGAVQDDGSLKPARWSTPLRDYRDFHGRRSAGYGEAVWNYPAGDFAYGKFTIQDIQVNLQGPDAGEKP
jgi:hypothetical protein